MPYVHTSLMIHRSTGGKMVCLHNQTTKNESGKLYWINLIAVRLKLITQMHIYELVLFAVWVSVCFNIFTFSCQFLDFSTFKCVFCSFFVTFSNDWYVNDCTDKRTKKKREKRDLQMQSTNKFQSKFNLNCTDEEEDESKNCWIE